MDQWSLETCSVLSPTVVTRIRSCYPKVNTLSDLLSIPRSELSNRTGITPKELELILSPIMKMCKQEAKSLISLIQQETSTVSLLIGDPVLDACLGDSVLKHDITLISGPPGSGKTQLLYTIVTKAIIQQKSCLYINGGCNFVLQRIIEMLSLHQVSVENCLQRLYIENETNPVALFDLLEKYELKLQSGMCWGCIVIDSITPFFQSLMNQEMVNGRSLLSHILLYLRQIAQHYRIPVLLTNQTRKDGEQKMKNALNTNINHFIDTCINLSHFENEKVIQIVKSHSHITPSFISFSISERGVEGIQKSDENPVSVS